MEHTALRPKPMPGRDPGGTRPEARPRRPHAARRRGRRLTTWLFGLLVGTVLVLAGVGLGTVGATVIGWSKVADLQRQAAAHRPPGPAPASPSPGAPSQAPAPAAPAVVRATLGVEVMDAQKPGALVVGVHVPGPGYTAGLVRGDIVLAVGRTRVDSAADLARAVAGAHPGRRVVLTVRHRSGGYQQLTAVPGIVT
ncbi:PDZ domain-containing protein [Streptomyces sp. Ru71]|uniref:PDZ domain-containing protein n=1 Tax=Streptomyces sp. Ru71 TaxID=2080746 RepID=UPI000CDE27C9|nr:PDZ domain-containing protein [Streptomyces sp. Ru71]POX51823.1 PDZ domain-containing protein [Streptomyces sp. Ru71]